jgi:hypothetical protein
VALSLRERWFYGLVGAAAPEVVRFYSLVKKPTEPELPNDIALYLIVSLLFIAIGGIFATAFEDDNKARCFYFGVSFPTVVSPLVAGGYRL